MLKKEYFSMEMKIADDKLSSLISSMAILRFLYTHWTRNNVKWKYAGACLFDVKTRMSVLFSIFFLSSFCLYHQIFQVLEVILDLLLTPILHSRAQKIKVKCENVRKIVKIPNENERVGKKALEMRNKSLMEAFALV